MQHQSALPAILHDCALDGTFNTMDIGSLAECLAWIRNNCYRYDEYFSVEMEQSLSLAKPIRLPSKMTKIHKYLNQLPVSSKKRDWIHYHSFLGQEVHVAFHRLDQTIFLVEFDFVELN